MFERFTDRARRVVTLAQEDARELNHNYIGTEHLLLGMLHEGEGVAAQALTALGIRRDDVREMVRQVIGVGQVPSTGSIPFTPRAKKVLELSLREALQLGHNFIGTEHILLGLLREGEGVGAEVLIKLGATLARARQQVIRILRGYGNDTAPKEGRWAKFVRPHGFGIACTCCAVDLTGLVTTPTEAIDKARDSGARIVNDQVVACTGCQERPLKEFIPAEEAE